MDLNRANNILNFIEEQERRERKKRTRLILVGVGILALSGVASVGAYSLVQGQSSMRSFQANQLTRSQVMTLFEQENTPILVKHAQTSRVDTIHSPEEYTMYLAAQAIESPVQPLTSRQRTQTPEDLLPVEVNGPLASADIMPAFPGGEAALYRFLSNQIRYPEDALSNKVEGKVFIRFVVQADGSVTDLDVLRGIGAGCDEEALRVVQLMPRWVPGELAGQPVPVYSSLAIEFKFL